MMIHLNDTTATAIEITGGKGSALARLIAEGFPVPEGRVISTLAFQSFCTQHGLQQKLEALLAHPNATSVAWLQKQVEPLQQEVKTLSLPAALLEQLRQCWPDSRLDGEVAVRSSAVAEDLQGASFAGQYDTVLGVDTFDGLINAIRQCWASFFNAHALHYKQQKSIADHRFAVVIQRLIPADAAGVAFSLNPVNGREDQIVINANWGLGESIVSGLVTPDMFIVEDQENVRQITHKTCGSKRLKCVGFGGESRHVDTDVSEQQCYSLTDDEILMVAELTRKVERKRQFAVDIEWALWQGHVWLLQARPITSTVTATLATVSTPPDAWVPRYQTTIEPSFPLHTNGNISEILPGCITPLTWSRIGPTIDYAFTQQYYEMGLIAEKPDPRNKLSALAFFYYRPYLCISYFTEVARNTPGLTPDIYLEEFVGRPEKPTPPFAWHDLKPTQLLKLVRMITALVVHALNNHRAVAAMQQEMAHFLASLSDDKIAQGDSVVLIDKIAFSEHYGQLSLTHIWASSYASLGFAIIRGLAKKWLGETTDTLAASLVTGIGVLPSAEPAFGIFELADTIKREPALLALFNNTDNERVYQALMQTPLEGKSQPAFDHARAKLSAFLAVHGHRGICEAELMTRCWRDQPSQIMGMIRNFLQPNAVSPAEIQHRQEKARLEATHSALARLSSVQRFLFEKLLHFTKHFIHQRELLKNLITLREDGARRIFRVLAQRLVKSNVLEEPDDIFFLTCDEVRAVFTGHLSDENARSALRERARDYAWSKQLHLPKIIDGKAAPVSPEALDANKQLSGIGVYPGKIEGRARVIMDPRENAIIEPGEILVAPVTDAGWTPLFINAAALVVEVGGLLSHGSVVAREYGLPAVVGAENATQRIKTGDRIVVDGGAGLVMILDY